MDSTSLWDRKPALKFRFERTSRIKAMKLSVLPYVSVSQSPIEIKITCITLRIRKVKVGYRL